MDSDTSPIWRTTSAQLQTSENQEDDNPPIGLLLCTDYGQTTVQYATEGFSQNLFVSKYRLQLPSEDDIRKYMLENITEEDFKEMME